ncbi:hypothetical protein BGZ54_005360, partial [Gamsiella multidivaricata]
MSPRRSTTNPDHIEESPSQQLVVFELTAEPARALSSAELPLTQIGEGELSQTASSDTALCRHGKRASSDDESDRWSEDRSELYDDYESRLVAAHMENEELRRALKHEQDRSPFVGRLFAPRICKDEGTQVDRETAEQGVQVEVEDDSRSEQRSRKRRRKARTTIVIHNHQTIQTINI